MKCQSDRKICKKLFAKIPGKCNQMFNGQKCTLECENGFKDLFMNNIARQLIKCKCDGTQYWEGVCIVMRKRINNMCKSDSFAQFIRDLKKVVEI